MQEAAKHLEKAKRHLIFAHTKMAEAFAEIKANTERLSAMIAAENLLQAGRDIAKLYASITEIRVLMECKE
jgi:hypothetical protein